MLYCQIFDMIDYPVYFRSTEDEFNPRAAQQKFLSHSLVDLLNQVCIKLCIYFEVVAFLPNIFIDRVLKIMMLELVGNP